jgi:hypothetical protein
VDEPRAVVRVDLDRYEDRARLERIEGGTRLFVLTGESRISPTGTWSGTGWHVVVEASDLALAVASCPGPGLIVTYDEITHDPVIVPLYQEWRNVTDSDL